MNKFKRWLIRLMIAAFVLIISSLIVVFGINAWVNFKTAPYIFTEIEHLSQNRVGLVLGTAKYYRNGNPNQYYSARINGAVELFKAGKIQYVLVSGDNRAINYNEPITMRKDLISAGIDPKFISLDYAGFRTLDSVVRAQKVFDTPVFTIITQRFHCERAIFIALKNNISAECYAVPDPYSGPVRFRELFARVAAVLDLYILNKEPYFLGPIIPIPSEQPIKPEDEAAYEMPHTRE